MQKDIIKYYNKVKDIINGKYDCKDVKKSNFIYIQN